jgi:two-component system, cell cycle response regulator DivK
MTFKVLVADDDFDNRIIARDTLEAAGYAVVMAVNGEEALEKIMSEKPDAVLLDLSMPKLTGWELARKVRSDKTLEHLPLIAFTAHALVGEELKAKAAGCNDYLAKPCMPKDILEKIARWVGAGRP